MEFALVDEGSAVARRLVGRYFDELAGRFDGGFDATAYRRGSVATGDGWFVIASVEGEPVGCGALQTIGVDMVEIKRMWVDPNTRGLGVGRRLLAELERRAAELGATTVRLDTNANLTEAIALYERAGYRSIPRYNDNPYAHVWFEKDLTGQTPPAATAGTDTTPTAGTRRK